MRTVSFADFLWEVKNACGTLVGPGPNFFSSRDASVCANADGLRLTTSFYDGKYFSSEVVLSLPLGYGIYEFVVGELNLDPQAVFAGFLYEDDVRELDIEFSERMIGKNLMQYVAQPGGKEGNLHVFPIDPHKKTRHSIRWEKDRIIFSSLYEEDSQHIRIWEYRGEDVPHPENAKFIFNLWLYEGKKPEKLDEVTIKNFSFLPL